MANVPWGRPAPRTGVTGVILVSAIFTSSDIVGSS